MNYRSRPDFVDDLFEGETIGDGRPDTLDRLFGGASNDSGCLGSCFRVLAVIGIAAVAYYCGGCEKKEEPKDVVPTARASATVDKTAPCEPTLVKKGVVNMGNTDEMRQRQ